ncbi:unnamed protein product [Pleuronectes platessa]|uniref:COMM domain-containing protein n=1 Tax=Pleuronectes platessa TaxID=8262 RepID=A0A9N7UWU9_PLEPL|nr:unnamed protein product [Pleuronectes platessa]
MTLHFTKDVLPETVSSDFQNLNKLDEQQFHRLIEILFQFLLEPKETERFMQQLTDFAGEQGMSAAPLRNLMKSVLLVPQGALKKNLAAELIREDLVTLGLSEDKASHFSQQWAEHQEALSRQAVSQGADGQPAAGHGVEVRSSSACPCPHVLLSQLLCMSITSSSHIKSQRNIREGLREREGEGNIQVSKELTGLFDRMKIRMFLYLCTDATWWSEASCSLVTPRCEHEISRNLREGLQIWFKYSPGLKDELMRFTVGNIYLQLKLVVRKGNSTENVFMELTLPQFLQLPARDGESQGQHGVLQLRGGALLQLIFVRTRLRLRLLLTL